MPTQLNTISYNQFGTEQTLLPNNKYNVFLNLEDLKVNLSFTSKYNPLYSTIDTINGDIGPFIIDFTDDEINRVIHSVSVEAQNIAYNTNEFLSEEAFDFENPPYYVKQYVRYKSEYVLAKKQYVKMARSAGSSKSLGDLQIEHGYNLGDLKDLLSVIKDDLKPWTDELLGRTGRGRAGMAYAVKSNNTDSPLMNERTGF